MLSANERISLRQLQVLIILSAMGTGLIFLPRRVAEYASQDGWAIVLALTVVAMAVAALVVCAARVKPGASFIGYAGYALSKPVAYLFGVLLWGKLVFAAGLELRAFLLITRQVLLNETPLGLVGAAMLAVCAYAAVKGIETRARVAEVLVLVLVIPLVFVFVIALLDIDWSNLQPVFVSAEPGRVLSGTLRLGFVFTGLECLLLASPYIAPGKKMGRAVVGAVGLAGLLITAVTTITLAKFGPAVVDEPWPVLRMMDMLPLPGAFIERQEALMFSFWIITVFALVNALIFFGGRLLGDGVRSVKKNASPTLRRDKKHPIFVFITTAAVFAITCLPLESTEIEQRLDWIYYTAGVFFLLIFPLAVLTGATLRKKISNIHRKKEKTADNSQHRYLTNAENNSQHYCKINTADSNQHHNKMNVVKSLFLLLFLASPLLTFSGCYDRVEIEDRVFVVAMALDKANSDDENDTARYTLTVLTSASEPSTSKPSEDDGDDTQIQAKKATGQTLTEAMHKLNEQANTRLYYGQVKLLVLTEMFLEDAALVKNTITTLAENPEIDRQMQIFALHGGEKSIVMEEFLQKIKGRVKFLTDLDTISKQLKDNAAALIPCYPEGAVVLKDFVKATTLTADQLRGFLWCMPEMNEDAVVTALHVDNPIPFTPDTHRVNVRFVEYSNSSPYASLRVIIDVHISGQAIEMPDTTTLEFAKLLIAKEITDEISTTTALLQAKSLDAYHWLDHMRKKQYDLYRQYHHRWEEIFPKLEIIPHVQVEIKVA